LNKTLAKIKDESFQLNGLWKFEDLPGFDEKVLIEEIPKYLSCIPTVRFIMTSYECNSTYIKLETITENEIAFSEVTTTLKFCHGDLKDYSKSVDKEFLFRLLKAKKYRLDDKIWYLKDESDNTMIVLTKINEAPNP
jgi:hypothetical protein